MHKERRINKMNAFTRVFSVVGLTLVALSLSAQEAGQSVKLDYGTVQSVQTVNAKGKRAAGTIIGGVAGGAIAKDHRGLGALAGGLIGGAIEKNQTSKQELQQYTVALMSGSTVVIDTEQRDMVVGDCVVVEQGQYANLRRVSDINCKPKYQQNPPHHKRDAGNCQKAKDELNNAKTDAAVNQAVIKVRTLCED
jgi:outer membrane lipoprotein SlyB